MKKFFPFLAVTLVILQSCDKIEMPYRESAGTVDTTSGGPTTVVKVRKVLIEDYTGHKCGNCPAAATKLEEIQAANPDRVIGIAVHAGSFAHTSPPNYNTDFATTTGDDWDTFFGISNAGNPNGMVNRKDYPASQHIKYHDTWAALASSALAVAPDAWIEITNNYNAATRVLNTEVKNEFLTAQNGTYKISVVITESGMVDYQKDYTQNPADIPNYTFKHVLRGSMTANASWGDTLATGAIAVGAQQTKNYSFTLPAGWNASNCHVVAFISNATTYEVMQAEEKKVIP